MAGSTNLVNNAGGEPQAADTLSSFRSRPFTKTCCSLNLRSAFIASPGKPRGHMKWPPSGVGHHPYQPCSAVNAILAIPNQRFSPNAGVAGAIKPQPHQRFACVAWSLPSRIKNFRVKTAIGPGTILDPIWATEAKIMKR